MNHPMRITTLLLNSLLMAAPAQAEETRYFGLCDASAAVALGETHFVVADDDRHVLTIYQRGKPEAVACVELLRNSGECLPRAKATKSDIEGAARIGDRIYWISSHARNQDGEIKAQRRQFFATDVLASAASPTVSAATPPYTRLIEDIAADPRFAVLSTASKQAIDPEMPGGLNIEGLTATPDGQLLIGFRNPLSEGKALLLPLRNPAAVIDQKARPVFGDLIALDLGERGIRSIDFVAPRFAIVAGPVGGKKSGKGFALYIWSGKAADSPQRVKKIDFADMHPEALFAAAGKNEIYVLSDDGKQCKDTKPGEKSFRGFSLTLPDPAH